MTFPLYNDLADSYNGDGLSTYNDASEDEGEGEQPVAVVKEATLYHKSRGVVRLRSTITTDASGNAAAVAIGSAHGRLVAVYYDAGDMDTGADIIVRDQRTGYAILTLTNAGTADRLVRPTANLSVADGAAVAAATTSTDVYRDIYLAGPVTVECAQGGNVKTGKLDLVVDEG